MHKSFYQPVKRFKLAIRSGSNLVFFVVLKFSIDFIDKFDMRGKRWPKDDNIYTCLHRKSISNDLQSFPDLVFIREYLLFHRVSLVKQVLLPILLTYDIN